LREQDESRLEAHQPCGLAQEMEEYVWQKAQDGKPVKELPVKVNDHAMDALRYLCMQLSGGVIYTGQDALRELQQRAEAKQGKAQDRLREKMRERLDWFW
jgi:hypothetical protein